MDDARVANGNMDQTARGVEKSCVRDAGKRPLLAHLSSKCVELYKRAAVARNIEEVIVVIHVEPMRPARWKHPVPHIIELGQLCRQHHRGFADCEKDLGSVTISHAPSRSPGQIDRRSLISVESQDLEFRAAGVIANAGNRRQA